MPSIPTLSYTVVHRLLCARSELALLDLREEDPFAQSHPLWAANLPLSRLELDVWRRIPRRDTRIVLYGECDGIDLVPIAATRLATLGYTCVYALEGGLAGWRAAGGVLFRDVNVPSKAFGEWVEHARHTPSLSATEVRTLIDGNANVVVLDARRFDEYQTMSIPQAISVPGAELVLRAQALAPDPETRIIVNCAGRTRSLIGTQSLLNAGLPNPIAALRNGTIGWTLAGQTLVHGADRQGRDTPITPAQRIAASVAARAVATRAGVQWQSLETLGTLEAAGRTLYRLDVRTPEEYATGHIAGFANVPGGQLVQETDHHVPVRGARLLLVDNDGVRAAMTASWLAQMGWDTYVLDAPPSAFAVSGMAPDVGPVALPPLPEVAQVQVGELAQWQASGGDPGVAVLDVSSGAHYTVRHIPGAWFAIRSQLAQALKRIPSADRYVLTCTTGTLARFAARDVQAWLAAHNRNASVSVLAGGNAAWQAAALPMESGDTALAVPRTDRYRRPYEGTQAGAEAMQAYLDWEFGLVAQLQQDGSHNFQVI